MCINKTCKSNIFCFLQGEELDVEEAVNRGLLDMETGIYTHPQSFDQMSIQEALGRGYLKSETEFKEDGNATGFFCE